MTDKKETEQKNTDENSEALRPDYPDYKSAIISIVRSNITPMVMREKLSDYHENDIAEAMRTLSVNERRKLFHILDKDLLADIASHLELDEVTEWFSTMDIALAADIISRLDTDDAVEILESLDKFRRDLILELVDKDFKKEVALVASYDDEAIGSKMTTNYIVIPNTYSISEAMKALIRQASDNDNISTIFVEDENEVFYGAIDLRDLIIARKDSQLNDIIRTSYPYVYGTEEIEDVIEEIKEYHEDSIPVLNHANSIVGIITSQNLVQVIDDELGEDYAMLAGLSEEEDLNESLADSLKKRLPWLIVLLFLGMLVSSVVGIFEKVVSVLPLIMAFQSLILGMSGNAGTQSLAVTIRVLMDESITSAERKKLIFKEMRVGLINGFCLGLMSFIVSSLYIYFFKSDGNLLFAISVAGCIGISLLIALVVSSLVGTVIPMIFKKIGVDPAVASGPLITTINDLIAVCTYYGLSWLFLIEILHLAG
jgi:magnesium transporter